MARNKRKKVSEHQDATENVPKKVPRTRKDNKKEEKDKDENVGPKNKGRGKNKKSEGCEQSEAGPSGVRAAAKKEPPKDAKPQIPPTIIEASDTDDDDTRPNPFDQVETEISFDLDDFDDDDEVTIRNGKCS